jgi:hypothetical protein
MTGGYPKSDSPCRKALGLFAASNCASAADRQRPHIDMYKVTHHKRTVMPVRSASRNRPPNKFPSGITLPAVTVAGSASPLLAILASVAQSSNGILSQDRRLAAVPAV